MEKLNNILKNLYNSDNKIMLYVYIAIAVVAVMLFLVIFISSIRTKRLNKKEKKPPVQNNQIPVINNLEKSATVQKETPFKEEKDLVLTETVPEIKPIPVREEIKAYDKSLELNSEIDLITPIKRVSTASDLLSEFLPEETVTGITAEELNKPLPFKEEVVKEKTTQPVYSSVFLDKKQGITLEPFEKTEIVAKPKIQLELTPITPLKIDSINEPPKREVKGLVLEPKVLKPEPLVKEIFSKEEKKSITTNDTKQKEKQNKEVKNSVNKFEEAINKKGNQSLKEELTKPVKSAQEKVTKEAFKKEEKPDNNEIISKKDNELLEKDDKHDESLDTKVDIFSHESIVQKNQVFDPFQPKKQEQLLGSESKEVKTEFEKSANNPTVLSAEDIKHRLSLLQSKITKKEKSLDNILKQVGLDELPDLHDEMNREEKRSLHR